jgi:hypothetical protein
MTETGVSLCLFIRPYIGARDMGEEIVNNDNNIHFFILASITKVFWLLWQDHTLLLSKTERKACRVCLLKDKGERVF